MNTPSSTADENVSIVLSDVAGAIIGDLCEIVADKTGVDFSALLGVLLDVEARHYLELLAQEGTIYMRADTPDSCSTECAAQEH